MARRYFADYLDSIDPERRAVGLSHDDLRSVGDRVT